ncbi:hypothetical protein D9M69_639110 [compost metagenome]
MPQTVPNRPMNGAVEPTEARMARPVCRRAVKASMPLRRARVIQSLTSSASCRCAFVLRWWAAASRPSSARARKGLLSSVPNLFRAVAKSSLCQKSCECLARRLYLMTSSAFTMITIHDARDMPINRTATALVTKSP